MYTQWKKNVILFLSSQTISLFGSMLVQYAITWFITLHTRSGLMVTISIVCGFLPTFFLSPFAGVWADRYNRKLLIILSDSMIAIATLVLAILFLTGHDAIWLLFAASAIRSVGAGIQSPAVAAFLPQIVPEDKLTRVNAANSTIQSLIMLTAPMLSGALLTFARLESIFFIDVVTASVAVAILWWFLPVPAHAKALIKQTTGYFSDLREGIVYIKDHIFVMRYFLFCAVFFVLAAPMAFLTPLQVARSFGSDVWRLTAVEITFSVGMMLGGIVMASWGGFRNKVHSMVLSTLIIAAGTFALGFVPGFWLYLICMGLMGIAMPLFHTPATVLLQQRVEENFLGRVFGVLAMIASAMMPLGMVIFGPLADLVAIEWLLMGTGILLFMQGLLLLNDQALIEAGEPVLSS